MHYFLIRGYENFHDGDEWIGIYSSISALQRAYTIESRNLEEDKIREIEKGHSCSGEKILIYIFDETDGTWQYNVSPEKLFGKEQGVKEEKHKRMNMRKEI